MYIGAFIMSEIQIPKSDNFSAERLCLIGALSYLGKYFQRSVNSSVKLSKPITPVFLSSNDRFKIFDHMKSQNNTMSFPFLGMRVEQLDINVESGYNPKSLARHRIPVPNQQDATLFSLLNIVPVMFDCSVSFLSDDFWDLLSFASAWERAHLNRDLNFTVQLASLSLSIQVSLVSSIQLPEKDNTVDIANYYDFIGSIQIKGFVSDNIDLDNLPRASKLSGINVNAYSVSEEQINNLPRLIEDAESGVKDNEILSYHLPTDFPII